MKAIVVFGLCILFWVLAMCVALGVRMLGYGYTALDLTSFGLGAGLILACWGIAQWISIVIEDNGES